MSSTSTPLTVSAGLPLDAPRTFPADFLAAAVDIEAVFNRAAASAVTAASERAASMARHPSRGKGSAKGRATTRERRLARELKYGSAA